MQRPSWTAITRPPTPALRRCALTFIPRQPIDLERALAQHAAYCDMLRRWGLTLEVLAPDLDHPDATFVEDTAVVLDEVALLARMGEPLRRSELEAVAPLLARHREVVAVESPATLEGGDVLRLGRTLLVGRSPRTNRAGAQLLRQVAGPLGYRVHEVPVRGCLHLKTGCTALDDETLLINPAWIDPDHPALRDLRRIEVAPGEPFAANVLRFGSHLCLAQGAPRTAARVEREGLSPELLALDELAKAEAGLTCLSLLFAT